MNMNNDDDDDVKKSNLDKERYEEEEDVKTTSTSIDLILPVSSAPTTNERKMSMPSPWDKMDEDDDGDDDKVDVEAEEKEDAASDENLKRKLDPRSSPIQFDSKKKTPRNINPISMKSGLEATQKLPRSKSRLFEKPHVFVPPSSEKDEFQRVRFKDGISSDDAESAEAAQKILSMCSLRDKYVYCKQKVYWGSYDPKKYQELYDRSEEELEKKGRWRKEMPFYARTKATESKIHAFRDMKKSDHMYRKSGGVFRVYIPKEREEDRKKYYVKPPSMNEFYKDYLYIVKTMNLGPVRSLSYQRLRLLSARFHLHQQLNLGRELKQQRIVRHRDFYNIRKVDTHVHHSSSMTQKHLLRFIKSKLKKSPDDNVLRASGAIKRGHVPEGNVTLSQLFESLGVTAYDLSVDTLDMHAHSTFRRFDRFNRKYVVCFSLARRFKKKKLSTLSLKHTHTHARTHAQIQSNRTIQTSNSFSQVR